jgi:hypothetical protein
MADDPKPRGEEEYPHRGRIQAQGGGTEQSISWARRTPPTKTEMLSMCTELESKLTPGELADREQGFAELRRYIEAAATGGGAPHGVRKSFPKRPTVASDIRVDLEVIKGSACVPDPPEISAGGVAQ